MLWLFIGLNGCFCSLHWHAHTPSITAVDLATAKLADRHRNASCRDDAKAQHSLEHTFPGRCTQLVRFGQSSPKTQRRAYRPSASITDHPSITAITAIPTKPQTQINPKQMRRKAKFDH